MWQEPTAILEQEVSGDSRERTEDTSFLDRKAEGEAPRNIISKLSEERNLRDLHLKHYHMSTAQSRRERTHLNIPRNMYDLNQHVVKTCRFCNSVRPRMERSRVTGLRAEEFGNFIFLDNGSAKIGDNTFGFLMILDVATSHTAYLCKSTSPSEGIANLHE